MTGALPVDSPTMRELVSRLLGADSELPSRDELEIWTLQLRGHLMLLIPEVEKVTAGRSLDDIPRACALAGVAEARTRLDLTPGAGLPAGIAHAQRLARSVNALLDHLQNLPPRPL